MQRIRSFIKWWNRPDKSVIADWIQGFIVIVPIAFAIRTWGYGLYKVPSGSMESTLLVGESFVSDKFTYTFIRTPHRGEIIAFNEPRFPYSANRLVNWAQHHIWGPQNWTKRVIGLPGEHVQGKIEEGKPVVYINGQKLDEPYLNKYSLIPSDVIRVGEDRGRVVWRTYDSNYSYEKQLFYRMNRGTVKRIQKLLEEHQEVTEKVPGTPMVGSGGEGSDIYDIHLKSKSVDGIDEYWAMGDNRLGSGDSRSFGSLNGDFIHGRIIFRLFSVDSDESWMIKDLLLHPFDFFTRIRWARWFQVVS